MLGAHREPGRSGRSRATTTAEAGVPHRAHRPGAGRRPAGSVRRGVRGLQLHRIPRDATVVNPLRVRPDVLNELQYRLLLCYVGQTRQSAKIIDRQTAAYREGHPHGRRRSHRLKLETLEMKKALLLGKIDGFGELLHQAWEHKKRLDPGISTGACRPALRLARKEGAIGGKMPGRGRRRLLPVPHALRPQAPRRRRAREAWAGRWCRSSSSARGLIAWASPRRVNAAPDARTPRDRAAAHRACSGRCSLARRPRPVPVPARRGARAAADVRGVTFTRQYPGFLFPGRDAARSRRDARPAFRPRRCSTRSAHGRWRRVGTCGSSALRPAP